MSQTPPHLADLALNSEQRGWYLGAARQTRLGLVMGFWLAFVGLVVWLLCSESAGRTGEGATEGSPAILLCWLAIALLGTIVEADQWLRRSEAVAVIDAGGISVRGLFGSRHAIPPDDVIWVSERGGRAGKFLVIAHQRREAQVGPGEQLERRRVRRAFVSLDELEDADSLRTALKTLLGERYREVRRGTHDEGSTAARDSC